MIGNLTLRRTLLAVLISGLVLGTAHLLGLGAVLAPGAPLLLLVVSLLIGHYPGAEAIVRLSERISRRPRAATTAPLRPAWPPPRGAAGGLLVALALCGRAPPA